MTRTFFVDVTLVDGVNLPQKGMTVAVEGNRIAAVESVHKAPPPGPQDRVFDARGLTLMPGLFQGHFHAAMDDIADFNDLDMKYPANYLTLIAARNAERMLRLGFTSAIGAGSPANIDVVLKHAIAAGLIAGPRMTACGRHICTTGESLDYHPTFWKTGFLGFGHPCDGPDEFRKAVRTEIKDGVDIVKVHVTGGHGSNYPHDIVSITYEELLAATNAAHERGKKIRTHAANKTGILACVRAGVDLIDHADSLDDECIEALLKSGTSITAGVHSTFRLLEVVAAAQAQQDNSSVVPAPSSPFHSEFKYALSEAQESLRHFREFLPKAVQAGVNVINGDDTGDKVVVPHGKYADELVTYVKEIGIPAKDVIAMATRSPARFLGHDDLGVIGQGKLADLIVLRGNPIEDITVLQKRSNLAVIMKDGAFVECSLAAGDIAQSKVSERSYATLRLA